MENDISRGVDSGAHSQANSPQLDLVGSTVEDDVRRLIARYGAASVKDAVKRQTQARRGPKSKREWLALQDILEDDARKWLEGGDPFNDRSNYSIAQVYTARHPGHSREATHRRLMKKLAKERKFFTYLRAFTLSEQGHYPYHNYIQSLEALAEVDPSAESISALLRHEKGCVADYTAKWGPPADNFTMVEVGEGAKASVSGGLLRRWSPTEGWVGQTRIRADA